MDYKFLKIRRLEESDSPAIQWVTLNRATKKNALSMALRDELITCLSECESAPEIKVLVLQGSGSCFSAGFDLKEALATQLESFDYRFRDFFDALYTFTKPLITSVQGFAFAGGFDVALAGDIIIADDLAQFGHLEVRFKVNALLSPLVARVGAAKAFEIATLGEPISAREAYRIGLLNKIVPREALDHETERVARILAKRPLEVLMQLKELKRKLPLMDYGTATHLELSRFRNLSHNQDVFKTLQQYVAEMGIDKV